MRTRKSLALRDVQALGSDWLRGRDSAPKSGERQVSRSAPEDGPTSHQRGGAEWSGWVLGTEFATGWPMQRKTMSRQVMAGRVFAVADARLDLSETAAIVTPLRETLPASCRTIA